MQKTIEALGFRLAQLAKVNTRNDRATSKTPASAPESTITGLLNELSRTGLQFGPQPVLATRSQPALAVEAQPPMPRHDYKKPPCCNSGRGTFKGSLYMSALYGSLVTYRTQLLSIVLDRIMPERSLANCYLKLPAVYHQRKRKHSAESTLDALNGWLSKRVRTQFEPDRPAHDCDYPLLRF